MTSNVNSLAMIAVTPMTQQKKSNGDGNWYEAMAEAWGQALNARADQISNQSDIISGGDNSPGAITRMTTLSLEMGFETNSAHTSISSVGSALETMARKQ